ncbi:MAG: hypothetical protein ACI9MC_000622 [Kiritimatiellia bacterium]|jgi:hypothetical protein
MYGDGQSGRRSEPAATRSTDRRGGHDLPHRYLRDVEMGLPRDANADAILPVQQRQT